MMNRKPDNEALLGVFNRTHASAEKKHANYVKPRFGGLNFCVKHFAGEVMYDIEGFIEKNNDSLNNQLIDLLEGSNNELMRTISTLRTGASKEANDVKLPAPLNSPVSVGRVRNRNGRKVISGMSQLKTVSRNFSAQLQNLSSTLGETSPLYIKCIKPNNVKMPGAFSNAMVLEQLRYSGVLEVVRIRRQGFPVKLDFKRFAHQFEVLVKREWGLSQNDDNWESICTRILTDYLTPDPADDKSPFQIGKTKVFLRDGGLDTLNHAVNEFYFSTAARIQSRYRGNAERTLYRKKLESAKLLANLARVMIEQRRYKEKRANIKSMQRAIRGRMGRKMFAFQKERVALARKKMASAVALQRIARGRKVRLEVKKMRSAFIVQSVARMLLEKREFSRKVRANGVLQRLARQVHAKKLVRMEQQKKKERDAAVKIAAFAMMKNATSKYDRVKKSILRLQCFFRVGQARAVLFSEKTKARLRREATERRAAVTMQGLSKIVAAKTERRRKQEVRNFTNSLVLVQCLWRVKSSRKDLQRRREIRNKSCAVKLAAFYRGGRDRLAYEKRRRCAIIAQSAYRMMMRREEYKEVGSAVVILQSSARRYRETTSFRRLRRDVIRVQCIARSKAKVASFKRIVRLVRCLQRVVRTFIRARLLQDIVLDAHRCAKRGDVEALVPLMGNCSIFDDLKNIRNRYDNNKSLLHSAAMSNSVELCALLCSDKRDVYAADAFGNSPFHIAAKHCSFSCMKFFADVALNVNVEGAAEAARNNHANNPKDNDNVGNNSGVIPVIKDGILKRKTWRGWERRYVALRQDLLQYFRRRGDAIPLEEVNLKKSFIRRGAEKFSFEIHSPCLVSKKNKEGVVCFSADSEMECQAWLMSLRRCDGQIKIEDATRRGRSQSATSSVLDLDKRAELCALRNKRGETALHVLCEFASQSRNGGSLPIEIALWLAENGQEFLSARNLDGNTPLHISVLNNCVDLAAALVRKGGDMNVKNNEGKSPLELIDNLRDIEKICMVANIKASERKALLPPPAKLHGCTYLTVLLMKVACIGANSLECPFLRIGVFNEEKEKVCEPQDISKFAHKSETCLFFCTQYHLQLPLENTESCFLLFEFCDEACSKKGKVTTNTMAWALLKLSDAVDRGNHSIEAFEPPVSLAAAVGGKRKFAIGKATKEELKPAANGTFLSLDTYITAAKV